jgi:hypothetical protein
MGFDDVRGEYLLEYENESLALLSLLTVVQTSGRFGTHFFPNELIK